VSTLDESLQQVLAVDGVRVAALVDIATGMVVCSGGDDGPDFAAAAASVADEARACRALLGPDGPGGPSGDLDEISVLMADRIHLTRILSTRPGEGLALFADVDRARVKFALATLRIAQLAPTVLA
jgi:hypothetical protein